MSKNGQKVVLFFAIASNMNDHEIQLTSYFAPSTISYCLFKVKSHESCILKVLFLQISISLKLTSKKLYEAHDTNFITNTKLQYNQFHESHIIFFLKNIQCLT